MTRTRTIAEIRAKREIQLRSEAVELRRRRDAMLHELKFASPWHGRGDLIRQELPRVLQRLQAVQLERSRL